MQAWPLPPWQQRQLATACQRMPGCCPGDEGHAGPVRSGRAGHCWVHLLCRRGPRSRPCRAGRHSAAKLTGVAAQRLLNTALTRCTSMGVQSTWHPQPLQRARQQSCTAPAQRQAGAMGQPYCQLCCQRGTRTHPSLPTCQVAQSASVATCARHMEVCLSMAIGSSDQQGRLPRTKHARHPAGRVRQRPSMAARCSAWSCCCACNIDPSTRLGCR